MFALAVSALALASPTAFRGRAATPRSAIRAGDPSFAYGLPGVTSFPGPFDPLGFSKAPEKVVKYYRESELMHCRVGMIATLGFLVQESFHPLFGGQITGPAINHIPQIPVFFWFFLTVSIGVCESYRIQIAYKDPRKVVSVDDPETPENEASGWDDSATFTLKEDYTPGDLGFDPLGLKPKDPAEYEEMQCKELNNGRLAMIAAAGFLAQETVNQKTILETLFGS